MNNNQPIFKNVFGKTWNDLPEVMKKHYQNRPFSNDIVVVEGVMNFRCKWYLKPIVWLLNIIPHYDEDNVPVVVRFKSEAKSQAFCFEREFNFKNKKPFLFKSKMYQVKDNEIMEMMKYGICWHLYYSYENETVWLKHKGYSLRILGKNYPLPLNFLLGKCEAYEKHIDDESFDMQATVTHPLFGKVYEYNGRFKVV